MAKSSGSTIVSLLFAAAAGDLSALKRHKVCRCIYDTYYTAATATTNYVDQ